MNPDRREVAAMFAPLGSVPSTVNSGQKPTQTQYPRQQSSSKIDEGKKIDSMRIDPDLIDLSKLTRSEDKHSKTGGMLDKAPEEMKQESEKKQKTMLSTLDQKKKELQRQKDAIEKLNQELQQLDAPVTKEITSLRSKIEAVDRELAKATKMRKQKEMELLQAINAVSQLADEKCALTERLKSIMYDFEASKQKKLEELEGELQQLKV